MIRLHLGDCLDVLPTMEAGAIDAVVTDPPYGLSFMGRSWDHGVPGEPYWRECLRVLKPCGYLMAFGGTRTYHRLTCAIEDAGFEIRDCLMWLFGSGFPKGRGCLKPAYEPIVLARRPGKRVLPLGIEECRVEGVKEGDPDRFVGCSKFNGKTYATDDHSLGMKSGAIDQSTGRWPPNLLLQHHPDCNGACHPECVVRTLGEQSGERRAGCAIEPAGEKRNNVYGKFNSLGRHVSYGDTGTAARFYPQFRYEPKASRRDRNEGCEGMEEKASLRDGGRFNSGGRTLVDGEWIETGSDPRPKANHHPTVKPTPLMEWLVQLACPEGGTVLDPFMGSGSTGKACVRAGRDFIGIDNDSQPGSFAIAERRIGAERAKTPLLAGI